MKLVVMVQQNHMVVLDEERNRDRSMIGYIASKLFFKLFFFKYIFCNHNTGEIDLPPSASEESESDDDIEKLKNEECSGHQ